MSTTSTETWKEPVPDLDWLAKRKEAVLDPELEIVDPHHHLWALPNQSYLLPDYRSDLETGHRVTASIYMEASMGYDAGNPDPLASASEINFALEAREYGNGVICDGIVFYVNLRRGDDARRILKEHVDRGRGALKGIRDTVAWSEHPALRNHRINPSRSDLGSDSFRIGAAAVGEAGLALDLWIYQDQLVELADVVRKVPNTKFVLDHCGGPLMLGPYAGQRSARLAAWKEGIARISELENVYMKIGGLGMRTLGFDFHLWPAPPSSEDLQRAWAPYVDACLAHFGPDRCMFESNFPVDKEVASYRTIWNAFKLLSAHLPETARVSLMAGTAKAVYFG